MANLEGLSRSGDEADDKGATLQHIQRPQTTADVGGPESEGAKTLVTS